MSEIISFRDFISLYKNFSANYLRSFGCLNSWWDEVVSSRICNRPHGQSTFVIRRRLVKVPAKKNKNIFAYLANFSLVFGLEQTSKNSLSFFMKVSSSENLVVDSVSVIYRVLICISNQYSG